MARIAMNFADEIRLFILVQFFSMPKNLLTWDQWLYISSEGSHATVFIALKSIVRSWV
jgi:hypothetical protein